jgi:hypothetical protein
VRDYPWERLLTDYRGAVVTWLTVPLQDAAEGAGSAARYEKRAVHVLAMVTIAAVLLWR